MCNCWKWKIRRKSLNSDWDWEYFSKILYLRFLGFKIMIEIKKDENVTNKERKRYRIYYDRK